MLISVGHGRLGREDMTTLLETAAIEAVVDIRRYPGSRHNPDVSSEVLTQWLPHAGIDYRHEPRLGGRRRLPSGEEREDPWWQVDQFAAYAAYTRTAEFADAFAELVEQASRRRTAMMCSESVWWRCHRRLVADVAVLAHEVEVEHLMHDGRLTSHPPAAGARVRSDGRVVWDCDRASS
ncbi:hypothetical protein CBI38_30120 [Rhodococcus oxybenzonivorans]|uniref:DUF488 domain-containing protein n=1 Tax=Rhodococcus oxybenzonivorans TaxID=1990687 RepID=A0A2S2C337_9NOCA|nr:DUF488 domain-containing protein [Rhodococcus oxybenzonivorans]AWK75178.1 hypothetical protein CBI38_30120 [Rhodococcus oxybenzonivorans]